MTKPAASYSRSEELADEMMFSEAGINNADTYAAEHVPDGSKKRKNKKQDDLTLRSYYFEGIEKLSPAQLANLDKLSKQRDDLVAKLAKLNNTAGADKQPKPDMKPQLTPEEIKHNQLSRMAGVNVTKFVKAGWQLPGGTIYAGMWNPEDLLPSTGPTAIAVLVQGLSPSRKDPSKINLKQVLAGEQEPALWEPGLAALFATLPNATEEQWQILMQTYLSPDIQRKDKAPTIKKAKSPKKKPVKRSSKGSEPLPEDPPLLELV